MSTQEAPPAELTTEQLHELWYWMQLTRQLEQVLTNLYRQNKVVGGLYRSLGQESGAVGTTYALRRRDDGSGDVIAPAIRNLGSMLMMGADPADVLRQYMAKGDGPTHGRETNVHFCDYRRGYVGLISHLGAMVEVMAGVALSMKLRGEDRVALVYIGDGGTSTGAFHEGMSVASALRLPLITVVENNAYAYSTPVRRQTAAASFLDKAPGYGAYGDRCDGNDVLAVYEMTRRALERVRDGGGPALLEVMTYRRKGHAEHDDQRYLPDGELAAWEKRDPLDLYERRLLDEGRAEPAQLEAITARAAREVDAARDAAEASPMPEPEGALGGVYDGDEGRVPWTRLATVDPHEA